MSSYTIDSTIIVTSTTVDTSVSVSLAGLSPGVYTVKVASVDYANRTGSCSNVLSFELQGLTKYHLMPSDILMCHNCHCSNSTYSTSCTVATV